MNPLNTLNNIEASFNGFYLKIFKIVNGIISLPTPTLLFFIFFCVFITLFGSILFNRLSVLNIRSEILYDKNLTARQKMLYDKPDNRILAIRFLSRKLKIVFLSAIVLPIVVFLFSFFFLTFKTEPFEFVLKQIWDKGLLLKGALTFIFAVFSSIAFYFIIFRRFLSGLSSDLSSIKSDVQNKKFEELTDTREIKKVLSGLTLNKYSPPDYYVPGKIFLGLDENFNPNYIDKKTFDESHIEILGKTGSGKGTSGVNIAYQLLAEKTYDDFVVFFDPKKDEWAGSVLNSLNLHNFHHIDLNAKIPQINPFYNIDKDDFIEMMNIAFNMELTGTDADFFRTEDRKGIRQVAYKIQGNKEFNISNVVKSLKFVEKNMKINLKYITNLVEEIASIEAIRTKKGLDLEELINQKGVLIIGGSTKSEAIKSVQNLILARILLILERRQNRKRHVTIIVDEFRYFVSKMTLDMLATLRDKNANMIMLHQSFGDFANSSLRQDAVEDSVITNSGIKIVYQINNPDTADKLAKMTGDISINKQIKEMDLAENFEMIQEKKLRLMENNKPYIDKGLFMNLPKGVSIILSEHLPKISFMQPIIVEKVRMPLEEAEPLKVKKEPKEKELTSEEKQAIHSSNDFDSYAKALEEEQSRIKDDTGQIKTIEIKHIKKANQNSNDNQTKE